MHYDIFNGDADGIISLVQLRLSNPIDSILVTGVKRDNQLLEAVPFEQKDTLTVLDISMAKNKDALQRALKLGLSVFYADHHIAGDIPIASNLDAHIDTAADTCTALIVDKLLNGQYHLWAITAAYGDNLISKADQLAQAMGLDDEPRVLLRELGTLINYNGYGACIDDLHYHPADLFRLLLNYSSPFELLADKSSPFYMLRKAYKDDISHARSVVPYYSSETLILYILPDNAASRRVSGIYGNELANRNPDCAHAVLTHNSDGLSYTVSLRAPLVNRQGAGKVCSLFDSGGGREAAGGINKLLEQDIEKLIEAVEDYY